MNKILIATEKPFSPIAVKKIREVFQSAGYGLDLLEKYSDPGTLIHAVKDVDGLIVRSDKITEEVLSAAAQLRIVVRAGAGYDNIDLKAATDRKIVVMNTPGQNANAVAELAIGMMIYMARGLFSGKPGTELLGKTLGIHAFGNVGRRVAEIARGFGMNVLAFDPFIPENVIASAGAEPVDSVEELYRRSNYVSLHIPATEETRKSIGYNLLKLMPTGGTLVNTARKEVIDEEELLKVFTGREDFRYVSDIAPDNAPVIAEEFPGRFYFTPKKMGAQTAEANINAGVAAARQIVNFFEKGDETFRVNK